MSIRPERLRRPFAAGAVTGACLVALFGASQAHADYTAKVTGTTLQLTGDKASDKLALAQTPTTLIADVGEDGTADFTLDRSTFSSVAVNAGAGDDEVRVFNAVDPVPLTMDGGAGNDTLLGNNGAEVLIGGAGNDFVDGNIGADTARLGHRQRPLPVGPRRRQRHRRRRGRQRHPRLQRLEHRRAHRDRRERVARPGHP